MRNASLAVLVFCFFSISVLPAAAPEAGSPTRAPHMPGHFLIRLDKPLNLTEQGEVALPTGRPALDAAMLQAESRRAELLLPGWSPGHPEAFRRHGLDRLYLFHLPAGADVVAVAERFDRLAGVIYAEPDWVDEASAVPNDALFPDQYGLDQASDADMDGPEAWEITTGSAGVIIAVLDSGIDSDHEDLASGRVLAGRDIVNDDLDPEDDAGHGTRVTSIASANTDNSVGVAGACWGCSILPVKVLDSGANGSAARFSSGVIWATDNGATLINYSASANAPNSARLDAIHYAYEAGVVLIGGAGNGDAYGDRKSVV